MLFEVHCKYHICVCIRARGSQMHRSIVFHLDDNHIQIQCVKHIVISNSLSRS